MWYLRLQVLLNIVAVLSLPFREEVHEHNAGEYFTPYLATAGLVSAALALFGVSAFAFGGVSILIAVGVALETMKQIDSQLMMRNYEGFLK